MKKKNNLYIKRKENRKNLFSKISLKMTKVNLLQLIKEIKKVNKIKEKNSTKMTSNLQNNPKRSNNKARHKTLHNLKPSNSHKI